MFPVDKLSRENTQPENMCDIVFETTKGRGGTVNRTSVKSKSSRPKGSLKKYSNKFCRIHKKTPVPESLFC